MEKIRSDKNGLAFNPGPDESYVGLMAPILKKLFCRKSDFSNRVTCRERQRQRPVQPSKDEVKIALEPDVNRLSCLVQRTILSPP